jgi:predicted alpha/beta-fold hydrolase
MRTSQLVFTMILLTCFIGTAAAGTYSYPLRDSYAATIVGTPNKFKADLPKVKRVDELKLKVFPQRETPEIFWYDESLKYSLAYQINEAPLIFIIAGTGASHRSPKMQVLQKAFYQAGFHVVSLASPTHPNFIVSASESGMPGLLAEDASDLYRVMELISGQLQKRLKISSYALTGYSLGAAHAAFVSKLDETKKAFSFQKVLLINPPVSLYNSVTLLDRMLDENLGVENVDQFLSRALDAFSDTYNAGDFIGFNDEFLFQVYKESQPKQTAMAALIGLSFRISLVNMLFTADVLTHHGYIVPKNRTLSRSDPLADYSKVAFRVSYEEFFEEFFQPFWATKGLSLSRDQLLTQLSLKGIEDYLKESAKIGLLTNADDLILQSGELEYLQQLFGDRAKIYPWGGHMGNLSYPETLQSITGFFVNSENGDLL